MVEERTPAPAPAGDEASASAAMAPAGAGSAPVAASAAAEGSLLGALAADERIRAAAEQNERTLWGSAFAVSLLYAAVIAAQVMGLGGLSGLEAELARREKERRGQDSTSISVELVPDPDKNSKTKKWQEGMQAPTPAPPQPTQTASLPQPQVEAEQAEQQPQEEPKEAEAEKETKGGEPSLRSLEALVDAAADNLTQQIKRHYDKKQRQEARPQRQAMYSGGGMQVRGMGASGKSDEFSKSVIAALMATRPGPFALWGRVLVTFQINPQGDLAYVRLLHSSGNKALDDAAIAAIRKARFQVPPPDLSPDARTYIIDYIFG